MENLKVKLVIDRVSAIKAGKTTYGEVTLTLTDADLASLTGKQRESLASLHLQGDALKFPQWHLDSVTIQYPPLTDASLDSLVIWLEAMEAERARIERKRAEQVEKNLVEWLATPDEDLISVQYDTAEVKKPYWSDRYGKDYESDPRYQERMPRLQGLRDAKRAEMEVARAEAKRQRDLAAQERDAKEKLRADQLAAWVRDQMPESLERFAAGLMKEDEILDSAREAMFSELSGYPRYERMDDDVVRSALAHQVDEDPDYLKVDYLTRDPEFLTQDEFDRAKELGTKVPGAEWKVKEHVGYFARHGRADDPELVRRSVLVTVQWGAIKLSREYAL